jgi:hypothetical protein
MWIRTLLRQVPAGGRRAAGLALMLLIALGWSSAGLAAFSYPLYYTVEMPPVLTGYEIDENQNQHTFYTSLLRGTLGGLPIEASTVTLKPGASTNAGGGQFTLKTAAGAVQNGLILMTTEGGHTTLLFLGTYLGARLQFRIVGPAADFGTAKLATKGLADTSFASHADYLDAVTQGVAKLAAVARAEAIAQANRNPELVSTYQQTSGSP